MDFGIWVKSRPREPELALGRSPGGLALRLPADATVDEPKAENRGGICGDRVKHRHRNRAYLVVEHICIFQLGKGG